jgi:hypothetical protein
MSASKVSTLELANDADVTLDDLDVVPDQRYQTHGQFHDLSRFNP